MVWKPSDAGFNAVKIAFLTSGTLELAILDQDMATAGAQGPKGSVSITSSSRNGALEEAIAVSVTAKSPSALDRASVVVEAVHVRMG